MNNVVKFPKRKRALPPLDLDAQKIKKAMPRASTVKGIFAVLFLLIRWPVFLLMYWLRLPIVFLCDLISIPMGAAWLFSLYAFPDKSEMIWGFGIASFTAFAVSWLYDSILMAISPQDMMRML